MTSCRRSTARSTTCNSPGSAARSSRGIFETVPKHSDPCEGFTMAAARSTDPSEVWLPVPGYSDYEVSNLGWVRGYRMRGTGRKRYATPRLMRPRVNPVTKYLRVCLYDGTARKEFTVHRLVAMAFIRQDLTPSDLVNHIDNRPANNRLANLEVRSAEGSTIHGRLFEMVRAAVRTELQEFLRQLRAE